MHREPQPRYKVRTSQRQYKGGLQVRRGCQQAPVFASAVDAWPLVQSAGRLRMRAWPCRAPATSLTFSIVRPPAPPSVVQLTWWDVETTSPNGEVLGRGGSFDKRSAEQAAAREALRALFPELELPGGGGT